MNIVSGLTLVTSASQWLYHNKNHTSATICDACIRYFIKKYYQSVYPVKQLCNEK